MSRIGKNPIEIPQGVEVKIDGSTVTVKGPKGTLTETFLDVVTIKQEGNQIVVTRKDDSVKNIHGLTRTLVANMVKGVTEGFEKALEINGIGYKAQKQGNKLVLTIGFSHPVEVEEPEGITIDVPTPNNIVVKGIDKQLVGQVATNIRNYKRPEPYKGKGIKYAGERIRRKEGKAGAKK
ncbi:50S ribosomal protein L6 [Clostridium sp. CAG:1219]|nr:50S ribosomal protein L6 [Clostridium sp. CAG:1219]